MPGDDKIISDWLNLPDDNIMKATDFLSIVENDNDISEELRRIVP